MREFEASEPFFTPIKRVRPDVADPTLLLGS